MSTLTCDVCHDEPALGVAAVPGVPVSMAYGRRCLEADAHPYEIVVMNTMLAGESYDGCAPWWRELVDHTLSHLGKTREQFDADVAAELAEFNQAFNDTKGGTEE